MLVELRLADLLLHVVVALVDLHVVAGVVDFLADLASVLREFRYEDRNTGKSRLEFHVRASKVFIFALEVKQTLLDIPLTIRITLLIRSV